MKKYWINYLLVFVIALIAFISLTIFIPKARPVLTTSKSKEEKAVDSKNKEVIHYVAIGDSLTEGIGDSTNSGGFVPLVAKDLKKEFKLNGIQVENFGKSGDRSDQILKRIKKNEEIQQAIGSADFLTVTVGGNDLMKVIKGELFKLTEDSFEKPLKNYQTELEKLFEEIRKYNEEAPIYILGIYNPFYLYFPEITEMQSIVDKWNQETKEIVSKEKNAYFIPINDLLYKGKDNEVGIVSKDGENEDSKQEAIKNNLLYEVDHFHPNNLGYQIMANAVRDELIDTKNKWLPK